MVDYLEEDYMINGAYYAELRLLHQDCEEKRKFDSRCFALAR